MGAADSAFQHSATPHRDSAVLAKVVQSDGLTEPTHSSHLDIDDAAGAKFDGSLRLPRIVKGFIQADRAFQFPLQLGMMPDVVFPQRLLDHQEFEVIELAKTLKIARPVRGIGIAAERNVGPARADSLEHVYVPPRFDLHLDSLV